MPCVRTGFLCLVFLSQFVSAGRFAEATTDADGIASAIADRLEQSDANSLHRAKWVQRFFETRSFAPAWTGKAGPPGARHPLVFTGPGPVTLAEPSAVSTIVHCATLSHTAVQVGLPLTGAISVMLVTD